MFNRKVATMEEKTSSIRVFELDKFNYPKFRGEIIELYLHAFTTGEYAQHIPSETAESTLDDMLRIGFGSMAFIGNRLAGVLIAIPLKNDVDFPREKFPEIDIENALYIAEVMTHTDFRGKGVATKLLDSFLQHVEDTHSNVVIRVWNENKPALQLYKKLGFREIGAEIVQRKMSLQREEFEMRKVYFRRPLTPKGG